MGKMSTRSRDGLGRPTTTTDTMPNLLNRGLQLVGLFLFVNGVYVAFFSANLFTTFGYYLVVLAATASVLSRILASNASLVPQESRATLRDVIQQEDTSKRTRKSNRGGVQRTDGSGQRQPTMHEADFRSRLDARQRLRHVRRTLARYVRDLLSNRTSHRRNGRDRL